MPITKASSNAVAPAAKGDLVVGNATNDSGVLAVGSTDQVLTVDSSTATGLKWATASAGGMTLISTTTLSGATTTLSSIPQTYNSLYLIVRGLTFNTSDKGFRLSPNDVTNLSNFTGVLDNDGEGPDVKGASSGTIYLSGGTEVLRTNANNVWQISINNYTSTTSFKPFNFTGLWGDAAARNVVANIGGVFRSNTAITSLVFDVERTNTFATGTVLLYGVK
jgi:hypothetical protein